MDYKRRWRALALGLAMAACGIAGMFAWQRGYWGLLTGSGLFMIWLSVLGWWNVAPARASALPDRAEDADAEDTHALLQHLLLDAAPVPMLAIAPDHVRALNRAARQTFYTDDRVIPVPAELLDPAEGYLRYEGRHWRIDRVHASNAAEGLTVAALIDVEREERTAEARSSAELIEILGHELLNGLSPIVSLAESAQAAAQKSPIDPALLDEILGPLARRAEGLQRFASAYRALARLPQPNVQPVAIDHFAQDLARAFGSRWPGVDLTLEADRELSWTMDRDQMNQAVWALLHNAAEAALDCDDPHVALSIATDGAHLVIAVTDSGGGIAPERAALIFRPFHSTKPEGSGIGLTLARQIALAHGGSLELAGTSPTTFRMTLPN